MIQRTCRCQLEDSKLCAEADYWLAPIAGHPYLNGLGCSCACHVLAAEETQPLPLVQPAEWAQVNSAPTPALETPTPDLFGGSSLPEPVVEVATETSTVGLVGEIAKPLRDDAQAFLFGEEESKEEWEKHWWGMPEWGFGDASPTRSIKVSFFTEEDALEFAKKLGVTITRKTDSLWYPPRDRLGPKEFVYKGPKTDSRYPICIPSKGRAQVQTTGKILDQLGVSYKFFVEETEGDAYISQLGEGRVVVMPFHDLGQGSIPARNFIWEWAKERGHKRHWTVDDNIENFYRASYNRRLIVLGGAIFRAMEDFVDRYENVAIAGPHHVGFVRDHDKLRPYTLNTRIYSCILLDTNLQHRWRGRYNEDTDLSLRLLKDGYCSVLFNALLMDKAETSIGDGKSGMKGGNHDALYEAGDYRRKFAESLKEQHPDVVEITWKFNRWHHQVDYRPFRQNRLKLKQGVIPIVAANEYDMELHRSKAIKLRAETA